MSAASHDTPAIRMAGVIKTFGAVVANRDASLEVACGEKGECPKLRLQAAERVVERFYGKPDASIEVTATTNEALEVLRALAKPREEP
jgi:hypothetical protein